MDSTTTEAAQTRRLGRKIAAAAGVGLLWLGIAGTSFAAVIWASQATGVAHVSTTGPTGGTVNVISDPSFSGPGQDYGMAITVTLPADASGPYATATTVATQSAQTNGCPAGAVTIPGGQVLTFSTSNNPGGAVAGKTTGFSSGGLNNQGKVLVHIDANAPSACENQSSIELPVSLTLP